MLKIIILVVPLAFSLFSPVGTRFHIPEDTQRILQSARETPSNVAPPRGGELIPDSDRFNWTVECDSVISHGDNDKCANIKNRDPGKMWHSNGTSFPHWIIVDLGSHLNVTGLAMTPRKTGTNGRIAAHEIQVSVDKKTWKTVAYGTWYNDNLVKITSFEPEVAHFIRLLATSEVLGNQWTSISELGVYSIKNRIDAPTVLGKWGPTINFPLVPVGAWVVPWSEKVITVSSHAHDHFDYQNADLSGVTFTSIWDAANKTISERYEGWTQHDMFCPGMSFDARGRMIVTGGNGENKTSIYNSLTDHWQPNTPMKMSRGYHSSVTCADGRIFTIGGSWKGPKSEEGSWKNGEIYDPDPRKETWTSLKNCLVKPMMTNDRENGYRADNHGWLFGWKDNAVFQAGPSFAMNWYDTTGKDGNTMPAGNRTGDWDAMCGVAIMYDAAKGKILTAGGAPDYKCSYASKNASIITLGEAKKNVSVEPAGKGMSYRRIFHSGVVLPNGDTFVVGGQEYGLPFSDNTPILEPEIYSPRTGTWTKMANNSIVRVYHSFALLLPDATVLVGGGGLCGSCNEEHCGPEFKPPADRKHENTNHFDAQIYTPPYLLASNGELLTRPVIRSISESSIPGTYTILTKTEVTNASMIRYGSATHGLNTDQRRIELTLCILSAGKYRFDVPRDAGIATPGYWMVFVIDAHGVPSNAYAIRLDPNPPPKTFQV